MKKKYLTTPEEVLALKDTDTKIYYDNTTTWHCQFMDGVLCRIYTNKSVMFNVCIDLTGNYYILVEEPVKDVTEEDIGKLCRFWDKGLGSQLMFGILEDICENINTKDLSYYCKDARWYDHCRRLTPTEIAEITGYKVEE